MAHQYLSSSFRSHALALTVWMVSPLFIECERPSIAEEPEFSKHAASPDNPAFAEEKDHLGSSINPAFVEQKDNVDRSISPDGRYTASQERNSREIVAAHSVAVVVRSVDGKELFRIPTEGMGYARLSPTFSKNSEFLATHSIVDSNLGTIGMLNQLVVHRCSTGERLFESNLSLHPEVILFHDDWILVAGESRRPESKYCCQILRSDNGSEVSTLLLPDRSGPTAEFISFKKLEIDDSWIQAHAIISYGSIFGPVNSKSHVTYKWDGQRVLELSRQGEKIVAVGSKLKNMYSWDNTQAEPLAELRKLGAIVTPYKLPSPSDTEDITGSYLRFSDDPTGGLSIDLSGVSLSDKSLVELLRRVPRLKELAFLNYQLNDLNQLAQINGLEVIRTQRALRATDLSAIANLKALKRVPWAFTSDEALRAVSEMKALESLELASKDVTDVGVDRICRMPSLRNIGLSATGVSAQGLQTLEAMPNVEIVAINFDAGATDQALKVLDGSQKIRALTLRRSEESSITDAGLEIIGRVANLERLDLGNIPITDKGIKHLLKLKKLKVLSLSGTRITNTTLEDLDQLQSLTRLHIEGCEKLTDAGLLELQNVNSLKSLFITPTGYDRGGFSKAGVAELRRLRPNLMIWPDT